VRSEARGNDGLGTGGLHDRPWRCFERGLEPVGVELGGRTGRQAGPRNADDIGFNDDVVGAADEKQVLDIVAAEQNELTLAVEIVDVNDAETGLTSPSAVVAGKCQPATGKAAQHQREQRQQHENDDEGDHIFDRRGQRFGARDREQDQLSRMRTAGRCR
jgi:hypothetical protein